MDSVSSILGQARFIEPPEVAAIKAFISDRYHTSVQIVVQSQQFIIVTSSAALAGTLRPELAAIQAAAKTKKRLIIRIGQ